MASALRSRGHQALFVCSASNEAARAVEARGFTRFHLRPTPGLLGAALLPWTSGFFETSFAVALFTRGVPYYAEALSKIIAQHSPAAVVADFTFPGAALAAEAADVPYATVYHAGLSFPGPGVPPFGSGLPLGEEWGSRGRLYRRLAGAVDVMAMGAVNGARRRLGLPEQEESFLTRPSSPWLNLVLTAEALEAPRAPLPPSTFFVGPCIDRERARDDEALLEQLDRSRPRVYVSLGTFFNNRPEFFRRIIETFSDGKLQLIVSAGAAFEKLSRASLPASVLLRKSVPQLALLPHVSAVIGHGGNNSTNETLAAGKPLLVVPVGGEQGDNASRVVFLGAGLRAELRRARPEELRAKVFRLLEEPGFSRRAEELAREVAKTDGVGSSAVLLERLAQSRARVERAPGSPLTFASASAQPAVALG